MSASAGQQAAHVETWRGAKFWNAVYNGASIAAHPDTIAEIERAIIADTSRTSIGAWSAWGVTFIPSKYVDYGKLIAIPKLEFKLAPNFKFSGASTVDDVVPFQRALSHSLWDRYLNPCRWLS